jgi:hypothetical protein
MTRFCAVLVAGAFLCDGRCEILSFDFKDPRGASQVDFRLKAPLESIQGTAKGVSGYVRVDPENLPAASGKIAVAKVARRSESADEIASSQ